MNDLEYIIPHSFYNLYPKIIVSSPFLDDELQADNLFAKSLPVSLLISAVHVLYMYCTVYMYM